VDRSLGRDQGKAGSFVVWELLALLGQTELSSSGCVDNGSKTSKAIGGLSLS